jgi:endonuclease I
MKKIILLFLANLFLCSVYSDIPTGYYNNASGLTGAPLKTALANIIRGHTKKSYDYLWTAFYTTDSKPNGTVWDMYSDIPDGTANGYPPYVYYFGTNQCSTTPGYENSCYNREHSFPKSYFNGVDGDTTYSDEFHLYPTDSYVNTRRNNYPYGLVGTASWTSMNGSKLGNCRWPGYTGVVFEPRDEFKGDLARTYFYMATRYQSSIASWEGDDPYGDAILDGTSYPCYETWFLDMLLAWNAADPVSQKEINRNEAVYAIQHNRNPFIDHPEYAAAIWGVGAPLPVPTIAGPASVCVNSTGNVYTTQAGMTEYTWTISAGGSITSGGSSTSNSVTITWNTSGARTVSVNYTNASLYRAVLPTVYNVTVNALPSPTISGPTSACVNSTGNSYTTQTGMTGYTWAVSSGGTITSGSGTNAIAVTWNTSGAKTVSVNYLNAGLCTATAATIYNVTVNALPTPTVSGPASACVNSTGNTYTTQTGMTGYTWAVSAGGTITAGSGTNAITVAWNTSGAKTVSVNYTDASSCAAVSATVYNVTINPLPVPTVSGPTPVNSGTSQVYSTEAGMTGYTWAVSAGGTITSGSGTNAITVLWNTTGAQSVSANYTNTNSCTASTATVYNVTVNNLQEPTNYPTNFSGHNIIIQWTDVTGGNLPTGYLVRMSPVGFSDISNPVDGVALANSSTDLNVAYSVQQACFSNLVPNTMYYFKIFPYSGSGNSINYKTDSPPQIQKATVQ